MEEIELEENDAEFIKQKMDYLYKLKNNLDIYLIIITSYRLSDLLSYEQKREIINVTDNPKNMKELAFANACFDTSYYTTKLTLKNPSEIKPIPNEKNVCLNFIVKIINALIAEKDINEINEMIRNDDTIKSAEYIYSTVVTVLKADNSISDYITQNVNLDFDNDPEAAEKLNKYMRLSKELLNIIATENKVKPYSELLDDDYNFIIEYSKRLKDLYENGMSFEDKIINENIIK